MSLNVKVPAIDGRFCCIVNRDAGALAAVISSYLSDGQSYLPVFAFPPLASPRSGSDGRDSEVYLSNLQGNDASVLINNAWARMGGSEYLILGGLDDKQKSYLSIPRGTKVIEIAEIVDVPAKLSQIFAAGKAELRCRPSDILPGLFVAHREGWRLLLDVAAPELGGLENGNAGIVVVENDEEVSSVVAVNYAACVGADLLVVQPIDKREVNRIHQGIQEWKENGDAVGLELVENAVTARIGGRSFDDYSYVTYFTEGLPYSLVVGNAAPSSYVHLSLKADLFVFNSIIFESLKPFRAAVVFSPVFFEDEETKWLVEFFKSRGYYLRELIGKDATFAAFHFSVQHFPYGVLHICSHGGEVDGWEVTEEFVDRDGKTHVIEYDEVVGYDPVPQKDGRIAVHRKTIFRRFDGLRWMSDELDKEEVPSYVLHDMWRALYQDQRGTLNPAAKRKKKDHIAASCAIRCVDSIHQGEFSVLASHSSPLVFNNTCWSWYEVAKFFLACGARGYIGTLWEIDNDAAVVGARTFYEGAISGTVLEAVHAALQAIGKTESKDVYVYWGLHFTTLPGAESAEDSRAEVFAELLQAVGGWKRQIERAPNEEVSRNAAKVLQDLFRELNTNFSPEDMKKFEQHLSWRSREGAV